MVTQRTEIKSALIHSFRKWTGSIVNLKLREEQKSGVGNVYLQAGQTWEGRDNYQTLPTVNEGNTRSQQTVTGTWYRVFPLHLPKHQYLTTEYKNMFMGINRTSQHVPVVLTTIKSCSSAYVNIEPDPSWL